MANRMQRLVQLGKKGLTAAPFAKTNPDLNISGETASLKAVEPIASASKDLAEDSISPLNSNASGAKEDDQSVVPKKRKRSKSSSDSDSSSSSNSSSTSSSSNSSSISSKSSRSGKGADVDETESPKTEPSTSKQR